MGKMNAQVKGEHTLTHICLSRDTALQGHTWQPCSLGRRPRPGPHLFHRDGSSSCRSTFISSNTFWALMSSSSA